MQVNLLSVSLAVVLITSASVLAAEPTPPSRSEIVISAGPWSGTSLDEYLREMLDYADKVTQSHSGRNVRPSDRLFETAVMRHLTFLLPEGDKRLPRLVELLSCEDARVRYVAMTLMNRDASASSRVAQAQKSNVELQSRLTALLRDELWETAAAAADRLAAVHPTGWPDELNEHIVRQLGSEDLRAILRAARLIRTVRNPPAEAEEPLLAALRRQPKGYAASELARALFHYGQIPAESVPEFIAAVRGSATRREVSGGMCCAPSAVGPARSAMELHELHSIGQRLGPKAVAAIPALIELLQDGDIETRRVAVVTLGKFGPLAKDALPHLRTVKTEHVEERYVRPVLFHSGGMTRFVTCIIPEVVTAYRQISGEPLHGAFPPGLAEYATDLLASWKSLLKSLDEACPELKGFVREQPEVRQITLTFAVFAALVSPRGKE